MTNYKSNLTFNPDYYSAEIEQEELVEERVSLNIVMKLLVAMVIFGTVVFFIKHNFTAIGLWLSKVEKIVLFENENKSPIIIREEEPPLNEIVFSAPKEAKLKEEQVSTVKKIKKKVGENVKSKALDNRELTDEYIKLVEQSLGKY